MPRVEWTARILGETAEVATSNDESGEAPKDEVPKDAVPTGEAAGDDSVRDSPKEDRLADRTRKKAESKARAAALDSAPVPSGTGDDSSAPLALDATSSEATPRLPPATRRGDTQWEDTEAGYVDRIAQLEYEVKNLQMFRSQADSTARNRTDSTASRQSLTPSALSRTASIKSVASLGVPGAA